MVGFRKALELARRHWDEVDYLTEYPSAYVFSVKDDIGFGGNGPVVVLKQSGRCTNFVDFELDADDLTVVREGYLSDLE